MSNGFVSVHLKKDKNNQVIMSFGYWDFFWNEPVKFRGEPRNTWFCLTMFLLEKHALTNDDVWKVLKKWQKKENNPVLKTK